MNLIQISTTVGKNPLEELIIFFVAEDGEDIYSQQKQGADCGSDHEFLIAKIC